MKTRAKKELKEGDTVIFVAGGFDIVHGGHCTFFEMAAVLGDYLVVQFASEAEQVKHKGRKSAYPPDHKRKLLESLWMVDQVLMGKVSDKESKPPIFDFEENFLEFTSRGFKVILTSTTDDPLSHEKRIFAEKYGASYVQLDKKISFDPISATEIRKRILSEPI